MTEMLETIIVLAVIAAVFAFGAGVLLLGSDLEDARHWRRPTPTKKTVVRHILVLVTSPLAIVIWPVAALWWLVTLPVRALMEAA